MYATEIKRRGSLITWSMPQIWMDTVQRHDKSRIARWREEENETEKQTEKGEPATTV